MPVKARRNLAIIRVLDVRRERLGRLLEGKGYAVQEMDLEGFHHDSRFPSPQAWVEWYCSTFGTKKTTEDSMVTRIEFEYVD